MVEVNRWNVIFLADSKSPEEVLLLRRAADKKFAPNFYTGIGGKIGDLPGLENETPLESAYRELEEETLGRLNKENTSLGEFARCIYDSGLTLYYFWGLCSNSEVPTTDPKDGILIWVNKNELLNHDLIPTTQAVCAEWQKRGMATDRPFTLFVREVGWENTVRLVEVIKVEDGLVGAEEE